MHDGAQQVSERTPAEVILPPDNLGLKRLQPRQRQPAHRARMHARDRCGGKTGKGKIVDDRLERPSARRAKLSRNSKLRTRRRPILLRGDIVAAKGVLQGHFPGVFPTEVVRDPSATKQSHQLA